MRLIDKRPCVDRRTFLSGGTVAAVGSALISAPAMKQAKVDIYEQSFPKLGMDTGKLLCSHSAGHISICSLVGRTIGHNVRLNAFYRAVPCRTTFRRSSSAAFRAHKGPVVAVE